MIHFFVVSYFITGSLLAFIKGIYTIICSFDFGLFGLKHADEVAFRCLSVVHPLTFRGQHVQACFNYRHIDDYIQDKAHASGGRWFHYGDPGSALV